MQTRVNARSSSSDHGRPPDLALPSPELRHWLPRHKAQVVAAIRSGRLTIIDARHLYGLSTEELAQWERAYDRDGERGLTLASRGRRRRPRGDR